MLRVHQWLGLRATLKLDKFVDDLALTVVGTRSAVQELAIRAYDWIEVRPRDELGMHGNVGSGLATPHSGP